MLKTLLKKQFREMFYSLYTNKKTGKVRNKAGIFGLLVLIAICAFSLGMLFFYMSGEMFKAFSDTELEYLPFAYMGIAGFVVSLLLASFFANSALYGAKDNELLLSMPIPPIKILIVRIISVYMSAFMTSAFVLIPTIIAWAIYAKASALSLVYSISGLFIVSLFATAVSCLLGFVIALILSKVQRKNIVTVVLTLFFLIAYYVFYFNMQRIVNSVITNGPVYAEKLKKYGFFFYRQGKAFTGDTASFLLITAISVLSFAAVCFILSKSFVYITTRQKNAPSRKRAQNIKLDFNQIKVQPLNKVLLKREFRRFVSSAAYLINVGLGIMLLLAAAVAMLIFKNDIRDGIKSLLLHINVQFSIDASVLVKIAVAMAIFMLSSTVFFTSVSITMEGKYFWIIRTSPLSASDIISAKINAHVILVGIPSVIAALISSYVLEINANEMVWIAVLCYAFVAFSAALGLWLNLKMPKLDWNDETVAVKQSIPGLITMFGGWAVAVGIGVGAYFLMDVIDINYYVYGLTLLFAAGYVALKRHLLKNGEKLLSEI